MIILPDINSDTVRWNALKPKPLERHARRLEFKSPRVTSSTKNSRKVFPLSRSTPLKLPRRSPILRLQENEYRINKLLAQGTFYPPQPPRFGKFKHLPPELQEMIWAFALDDALPLLETYWDPLSATFKTAGPISQILSVCGPLQKDVSKLLLTSRFSSTNKTTMSTIIFRPELDTLYLPHLNSINIHALLTQPSVQRLKHLAITLSTSEALLSPLGVVFSVFQLMRHLPALETVTIVEGHMRGDEEKLCRRRYQEGHDVRWDFMELPEFWAWHNWRSDWFFGDIDKVRTKFEELVASVRKSEEWVAPPKILGTRFLRFFAWNEAELRPNTELEEWAGVGAAK